MAKTRAYLRERALRAADMVGLVDEDEANDVIQEETEELYKKLVGAYEDYAVTESGTLTPALGTDYIATPADFYKLRGVDWQRNGSWTELPRFDASQRNRRGERKYRLEGRRIYITPADVAPNTNLRIRYVPTCYVWADDVTAGFDDHEWYKRIILSSAIRFRGMQESDVSLLAAELATLDAQLNVLIDNRDAGEPAQTIDRRRDLKGLLRRGFMPDEDIP